MIPFVIHIPLLLLLVLLFRKKYAGEPLYSFFIPALAAKLAAGIVMGLLYTHIYTYGGDTFAYQQYADQLTNILRKDPPQYLKIFLFNDFGEIKTPVKLMLAEPRVLFTVKLLSLLNFFTLGSYWVNALYLSFFCFSGLWYLGNRLVKDFSLSPAAVAISFFFFPSVVLWSAGVLKESIVIGIIGYTLGLYLCLIKGHKHLLITAILFIAFFWTGWKIKYFYFMVLGCAMISYTGLHLIENKISLRSTGIKNTLLLIQFLLITLAAVMLIPSLDPNHLIEIMFISYDHIIRHTAGENYFILTGLEPSLHSYIVHLPEAFFTGLFRPFAWEVSGWLPLLTGLENVLLALLSVVLIAEKIRTKAVTIPPYVFAVMIYIALTAILMAYIAPNWGTLSRYKAGFLMFLVLIILNKNPVIAMLEKERRR